MAFVIKDRVKETSTTTGTGTLTLAGAVTGFQSFSAIGNANTTGYGIIAVDANGVPTGEWETGIGTYTSAGTTLSRGLIASSTGSLVSFAAGTKHVICCDISGYMTPLVMATTANRAIQIADQTALGSVSGNSRGYGAVDLQSVRGNAAQVASGAKSVIGGGRYNKASNSYSTVSGGFTNTASGSFSTCGGGSYSTATQAASTVSGGKYNTASAPYATVPGGLNALANKYGQMSHASGAFANQGDAQASQLVGRNQTTNNTATEIFLDGSSSRITLANDTTWLFEIALITRRTDADGTNSGWTATGVIKRDTNAASTAIVGAVTTVLVAQDAGAALTVFTVTADTTNGSLTLNVTGETGKTYNWVARVRLTEVTG